MELHIREFEYQNIIKQQFYKQLVVLSLYVLLLIFALESILYGFDPQSAVSYEQMDIQLICLEAWLDIMQEATEHNSIKKRLTNELHSLHDRLEELSTIHSQKEVRDMYILLLRRMDQYFRVVS